MSERLPSVAKSAGSAHTKQRAQEIYTGILYDLFCDRDSLFSYLFVAQWVFAVLLAVLWSPYTWEGQTRLLHLHLYLAIFGGALLCIPPLLLIRILPGMKLTRHMIAVIQMLWSVLLIHLSGGRIETHFHVFGSLAFMAFYRDSRVLLTSTVVIAADHLLRGMLWPESVYGLRNPEWWRVLEHIFWVLFEDIVLLMSIFEAQRSILEVSKRQAETEWLNSSLEDKVTERTEALYNANQRLQGSLGELRVTQRKLIEASRKAGMADVATSVLHNVGNVLNSVNVSASLVSDAMRGSKLSGLPKALALLHAQPDPARFLCEDPKGKKLIDYLGIIAKATEAERHKIADELASLSKNVEHIKVIVGMQQSYARPGGMKERLSLESVIRDAIHTNTASYEKHEIDSRFEGAGVAELDCDRHKLFQILVNLLSNAKHALATQEGEKKITVRIRREGDEALVEVVDNGVGIAPEHLDKIFVHGFTTKKEGHGFGLHSCANAAVEMGGRLTVESDGVGKGARFILYLPIDAAAAARRAA